MSVAVCVPIKYPAGEWLHLFLREAEQFEDVSRFIFSYGRPDGNVGGGDPTLIKLKKWIKTTKHRVEVYEEPKLETNVPNMISAIYKDFQQMIDPIVETHVLLADSDVVKMPKNIIQKLKLQDKDIIAPYVWMRDHIPPLFYDTHIFRVNGKRFHPFKPPQPKESFRVDSVGTFFLVKSKVFKEISYRDYPHLSFCNDARAKGYEVWVDPRLKVWHLDITRLGIFHMPPFPDMTPYVTDGGKEFTPMETAAQMGRAYIEGRVPQEVG
jgi:hypothetical protein